MKKLIGGLKHEEIQISTSILTTAHSLILKFENIEIMEELMTEFNITYSFKNDGNDMLQGILYRKILMSRNKNYLRIHIFFVP